MSKINLLRTLLTSQNRYAPCSWRVTNGYGGEPQQKAFNDIKQTEHAWRSAVSEPGTFFMYMVARTISTTGLTGQELPRMFQSSNTESTTLDHILISRSTLAKGCHRSFQVETPELPAHCRQFHNTSKLHYYNTDISRWSYQAHKKHLCETQNPRIGNTWQRSAIQCRIIVYAQFAKQYN